MTAVSRVGFFTDTSVCIGCKACEVACKEWNTLPMDDAHGVRDVIGLSGMSYDNTGQLGANSWRHVAFIEQTRTVDLPMPTFGRPGDDREDSGRKLEAQLRFHAAVSRPVTGSLRDSVWNPPGSHPARPRGI